jgi:hypothetical protein
MKLKICGKDYRIIFKDKIKNDGYECDGLTDTESRIIYLLKV